MKQLIEFLKGKKTYFCIGMGALYLIGVSLGFYEFDVKVLCALGLGALASLRAGVEKGKIDPEQLIAQVLESLRNQSPKMIVLASLILVSAGCSTFSTVQTDMNYEDGKPTRQITTRAKAHTFFDAKSALANFAATQTDKSQSAKVGSLSSESSGTNAVKVLEHIEAIVKALPK